MNDLKRSLAPIPDAAWSAIEAEARSTLRTYLAARKVVELAGPLGWDHSAVNLGRTTELEGGPLEGVRTRLRDVQPLVELRVPFTLARTELDSIERGSADPDLDPLVEAARTLASAEDRLVFYGWEDARVEGLCPGCSHDPIEGGGDFSDYPRLVSEATNVLRQAGIGGPYALALGPEAYTGLAETVGSGGYPVINHVHQIFDGPIVWAPTLAGGVVLSLRGGDFELTLGRDAAIGYRSHDEDSVRLYLEESLSFRVLTPEAAVPLQPPTAG